MTDKPTPCSAATDRYLHGAYHPNGECPNGMCAQPSRRAHPDAELVPWGGKTLCKCPHCGGLDVSYLGRDGLDICGSCHGLFVCRQEALDGT